MFIIIVFLTSGTCVRRFLSWMLKPFRKRSNKEPSFRSPCWSLRWTTTYGHALYHAVKPPHVSMQRPAICLLLQLLMHARRSRTLCSGICMLTKSIWKHFFCDEVDLDLDIFVKNQDWRIFGTQNSHVPISLKVYPVNPKRSVFGHHFTQNDSFVILDT